MSYARKHLANVEGYVPGEQPTEANYIKLNTNENPYPPSPLVLKAINEVAGESMRKYPDANWRGLRQRISTIYGVTPDQIFVGNGSDEVLSLLIRTFVDPGEKVICMYPTYVLYETLSLLNDIECEMVELGEDFGLPEELFDKKGKLLFLPNPNAPTGMSVSPDVVARLCRSFDGLVVADEAYADFSRSSSLAIFAEYPNLIILRTFSKSFSLAGIRVGFALAREGQISELMKTKDSYNVNLLSQAAAEAALDDMDYMRANVEKTIATRERMSEALKDLGLIVYPSEANFVLAKDPKGNARGLYEELKKRKILVRYFSLPRLEDCLRISVGTDEEVDALLRELADILEG